LNGTKDDVTELQTL